MPEPAPFKSGKDLADEPTIDDEERITCMDCGGTTTDAAAYDSGWQFDPPVCPSCLRWYATADETCCAARPS